MKAKLILLSCLVAFTVQSEPMSDARANQIADAIYKLEGGAKTKYPYGVKSVKTSNPRQVCLNTIKNNYIRWQKSGTTNDYLTFLGNRYAPVKGDKTNLNKNWINNIHKLIK